MGELALLFLFFLAAREAKGGTAPQLPAGSVPEQGIQTSWPQVIPSSLPPFPGRGWQYDEPPPDAVVKRAGQLVKELWSEGKHAHRVEQTAGRWIAYRAEVMRSGKKGVAAYRLATASPKPAAKPTTAATSSPAVPVSNPPPLLASVLNQLSTADGVETVQGHTYRWKLEASGFTSVDPIANELAKLGASEIVITAGTPIRVAFTLRAFRTQRVALNTWTGFDFGGVVYRIRFTEIYEVLPEGQPVSYLPPGARALPTLRRGMGIKPQPPNDDVKLLQKKLGIDVDGRFGPDTDAALRAFQAQQLASGRRGWTAADVDGVCGPKTWTALLEVRA